MIKREQRFTGIVGPFVEGETCCIDKEPMAVWTSGIQVLGTGFGSDGEPEALTRSFICPACLSSIIMFGRHMPPMPGEGGVISDRSDR